MSFKQLQGKLKEIHSHIKELKNISVKNEFSITLKSIMHGLSPFIATRAATGSLSKGAAISLMHHGTGAEIFKAGYRSWIPNSPHKL